MTIEQLSKPFWIKDAIKKPGALRKALDIKAGKKIPSNELKITKKDSPLMAKRKNLAKTLKSFKK